MVSDPDIYRTAQMLIDQHGNEAPIIAAMRSDEWLAEGDIDGRDAWLRVLGAIGELLRSQPLSGEHLN